MLKYVVFAAALACATGAQASSIASLAISDLTFDIQTETVVSSDVSTYTGISGFAPGDTVGWSVNAFSPLSDLTSTQSFSGFGTVPAQSYEHVHVHGFTITFDEAIDELLFVVENDNNNTLNGVLLDLQIAAADAQGVLLPTGTGYSITTANAATWVLYEFAAPVTQVVNIAGPAADGFDMAFFAGSSVAPIPLPASVPLLGAGLGVLVLVSRRRRRRA
ncbi:VPLPA-CTERM sorting domain-containing protein [Dinoroseobacter sp. S375]|uniref:VPLPA-CTERM sorting domain-containing protein n=1 Tax=Dinoroseobacter sp. S375 TaxID=3415136 RepID=UPI003C79D501